MSDMARLMKQAQQLQEEMNQVQSKLEALEAEGIAGGGLARAVFSGNWKLKSLTLQEDLLKEPEVTIVEDIISAAINAALGNLNKKREELMSTSMAGRMPSHLFS